VDIPNYMKSQSTKRSSGRHRREMVDRFRTQAWFSYIQSVENLSAYSLEKKFEGTQFREDGALISRPKKWDRYRRGDSTPGRRQIEKIAEVHPYSMELIDHPIWAFMRNEPPHLWEIVSSIKAVNPALGGFISELANPYKVESNGRYLNRSIDALWKTGSLDALMALVGAYRVSVKCDKPDVALIFPAPILSLVLHHAAYGSFNYSGFLLHNYLIDMINEDQTLRSKIKLPTEDDFSHTVGRLRDLRGVLQTRFGIFYDVSEFVNPLNFYLNELGIVCPCSCEFRSRGDISELLRLPNLPDDESLIDLILPLMQPRRRTKKL